MGDDSDAPELPDLSGLKPGWSSLSSPKRWPHTEELPPDLQTLIRELVERAAEPGELCRELANLCRTNRTFADWCRKKDTDAGSDEEIWREYFETAFGPLDVARLSPELSDGSWKQLFKDACWMLTQVPWLSELRRMTKDEIFERYQAMVDGSVTWLDMVIILRLGGLSAPQRARLGRWRTSEYIVWRFRLRSGTA